MSTQFGAFYSEYKFLQAFHQQGNWFSVSDPKNRAEHQLLSELHNSQGNSLFIHYQTKFPTVICMYGQLDSLHKRSCSGNDVADPDFVEAIRFFVHFSTFDDDRRSSEQPANIVRILCYARRHKTEIYEQDEIMHTDIITT
jgi:hypothetical protein